MSRGRNIQGVVHHCYNGRYLADREDGEAYHRGPLLLTFSKYTKVQLLFCLHVIVYPYSNLNGDLA